MSSSGVAISVRGVSKSYLIAHEEERPTTLGEAVMRKLKAPLDRPQKETFWALKDISFEVQPGEVVGLIGRNGAGKSTLLKILSRITEPTLGEIDIWGRVGSLLEVGTGFHPELTGRENIFLNGAILGMRRREIQRKFDEIVAFSEVEKFLDTPVKRFSSGMYVRLAFSVAAHLEPEILLIDEVLAVGDQNFQRKCLGKMDDVARSGRTVLFVSHNMSAVGQLCQRCVWLEDGGVRDILPAGDAVRQYLASTLSGTSSAEFGEDEAKPFQYSFARVVDMDGKPSSEVSCDDGFALEIGIRMREQLQRLRMAFKIRNAEGVVALFSETTDLDPDLADRLETGEHVFRIVVPKRLLAPDQYNLELRATGAKGNRLALIQGICPFSVVDLTTRRSDDRPGVIGFLLPWEHISGNESGGASPRFEDTEPEAAVG